MPMQPSWRRTIQRYGAAIEFKWRAVPLDEPRNDKGSTSIGCGKKRSAGNIAIAEQIGCESGGDHTDDDRPSHDRAERDQEAGGDARCGPKHRDAVRLVEQRKAQASCEEIDDRDRDCEGPRRPCGKRVRWRCIACRHLQVHCAHLPNRRNLTRIVLA